jgi:hypothetical protein
LSASTPRARAVLAVVILRCESGTRYLRAPAGAIRRGFADVTRARGCCAAHGAAATCLIPTE